MLWKSLWLSQIWLPFLNQKVSLGAQQEKAKSKSQISSTALNNLEISYRPGDWFKWGQKALVHHSGQIKGKSLTLSLSSSSGSGVLLQQDFLKLPSESERVLRQSISISPTRAPLSPSLNWMPQNNRLIMWLSERGFHVFQMNQAQCDNQFFHRCKKLRRGRKKEGRRLEATEISSYARDINYISYN